MIGQKTTKIASLLCYNRAIQINAHEKKMKKFLKIYLSVALVSSVLMFFVTGNFGLADYKLDKKIKHKVWYKTVVHQIKSAKKDENNTLYLCLTMTKAPQNTTKEYLLKVPLRAYEDYDASSFHEWHYEKHISAKAKERGFIQKRQEGYAVIFPESALIEGCDFNKGLSSISISKENPPFKKPPSNSVNDYPTHLDIETSKKDIIYYPLAIPHGYRSVHSSFLYATQKDFVGASWHDEKSNYLIIGVDADRYHHSNKALKWAKPLAIIIDILTAPFQMIGAVFIFGFMMINGVKC